jgi:hypothetical protein
MLMNGIEPLQPGVLDQFATWIREDSFRSMGDGNGIGRVDYRAAMEGCRQPALFVAAEKDGLAPPSVVQAAFRRWGGPKEYIVFERDYGHTDLLLGRQAPEVVYPVVRDFLVRHSAVSAKDLPRPRASGGEGRGEGEPGGPGPR